MEAKTKDGLLSALVSHWSGTKPTEGSNASRMRLSLSSRQIGWTSGGYFNYECGLDITDSAGTSLYSLAGCSSSSTCSHTGPEPTVPEGLGTDSDDSDASVQ